MDKLKLLLVDDHPLVRAGLKLALEREGWLEVFGEASTAAEAFEILKRMCPDVALMDHEIPGMKGIDAITHVKEICPETKIIILTMFGQDSLLNKAKRLGADGFVDKMASLDELIRAIKLISEGGNYFHPNKKIEGHANYDRILPAEIDKTPLTHREIEILKLTAEGYTSQKIADSLFISYFTVTQHRKNIIKKLKVNNTIEAINYAKEQNLF